MKKYLFAYAVLATALLFFTCRHYRAENRRLVENQTALAADVTRYRTRLGAEAASVQALRLRCGEFETLRAADAEQIRRLGIRLRRLEAAAKAVAVTDAEIHITPALAHNYAYTFTITNEPLEEILRIMSRINPIAYTFAEDNTVTISELE